jgi:hypothetical protein
MSNPPVKDAEHDRTQELPALRCSVSPEITRKNGLRSIVAPWRRNSRSSRSVYLEAWVAAHKAASLGR